MIRFLIALFRGEIQIGITDTPSEANPHKTGNGSHE
jgi:hypothetical protein